MIRALLPCAALLALTVGCGGDTDEPRPGELPSNAPVSPPASGLVSGTLLRVGGPAGTEPTPVPGELTFTGPGGSVVTTTVDDTGRYAIALSPGDYKITGTSTKTGGVECRTADEVITLTADGDTEADVICSIR